MDATRHPAVVVTSNPTLVWSGGTGPAHGELWAALRGRELTVSVNGSLCVATGRAVAEALDGLMCHHDGPVAIDLSGVTYCDIHGARAVMSVRRHCQDDDVEVVLTEPSGPVVRIFDRSGFSGSFDRGRSGHRWTPRGHLHGPGRSARPRSEPRGH